MRYTDIVKNRSLKKVTFDFFYWFSRFEYALKENEFLKKGRYYSSAEADWKKFIVKFEKNYSLNNEAKELLENPPQSQIVKNENLEWCDIIFKDEQSELSKIVLIIKTIRNNLFHGGKHGHIDWDNPDRTEFLLKRGIIILNDFSKLSELNEDYYGYY